MSTLTTNLVAYYKLADATDATGGTTLTATGSPSYGAGKVGNAVDFGSANTTKNLYRTPAILSYSNLGTAWSVSFWFNMTTGGALQYITRFILNNGTNERNFSLYLTTGNVPEASCFDGSGHTVTSSGGAISSGTWYHYTVKYDSGTLYLYINGTQVGSLTFSWSGYARTSFSNFSIGAEQLTAGGALSTYFSGKIDEYGVWNKALTSGEIAELYNSGTGTTHPFATDVTVSDTVKTATFTIPAYTITAERFITVTPTAPSATFTIPSPTTSGGAGVSPAVKTATFSIPAYSVTADGAVTELPSAQVCTFTIPSYTVTAIANVDVSPSVQVLTFTIPAHNETVVSNITISPSVLSMSFSIPTYTALGDYWEDKFAVPATSWGNKY